MRKGLTHGKYYLPTAGIQDVKTEMCHSQGKKWEWLGPKPLQGPVRALGVGMSMVPMPCRPLGSGGGRCEVWGPTSFPSSLPPFLSGLDVAALCPSSSA